MMGTVCRAGTAYPTGAPSSTPVLRGVRVARSLVFRYRGLASVVSVVRNTNYDCPFWYFRALLNCR